MAKKGTGKKQQQTRDDGATAGGLEIKDDRFKEIHTNPKFARKPKNVGKVTVDKRFQHMFSDEHFDEGQQAKVDKYGRKVGKKARKPGSSLKRFYAVEEDEKKKKEDSRMEYLNMVARGEIELEESSSSEESEEDEEMEDGEVVIGRNPLDPTEGEVAPLKQRQEEEIPLGEATKRLAVQNLDWASLSAQDIFVALQSFLPVGGQLESVTVYVSLFGEERMAEEECYGPRIGNTKSRFQVEAEPSKKDTKKMEGGDEEEDEEELEDDQDELDIIQEQVTSDEPFDQELLRQYELDKLKYYFAVAVFDSVKTANHVYTECDGVEFERSSITFDLRFIPDEVEMDRPVRDRAQDVSDDYVAPTFVTKALQSSKVELTWDEDDKSRNKLRDWKEQAKRKGAKMIGERDLEAFIASGSEDEDEEDSDFEEQARKRKSRDALRAALLGGDDDDDEEEEEEEDKSDEEEEAARKEGEKVVTFLPSKDKGKKQSMMIERKSSKKTKKNEEGAEDDDNDPFNDPFFTNPDSENNKKKKKGKKGNKDEDDDEDEKDDNENEDERLRREKAELELLLLNEKSRKQGKGLEGFDFKTIVHGEKLLAKNAKIKGKKRKQKQQAIEAVKNDDFKVNTEDSRFQSFYEDPDFSIDRTSSQYRNTQGTRDLEDEALRRSRARKNKRHSDATAPKSSSANDDDLQNMVAKLKKKSRRM